MYKIPKYKILGKMSISAFRKNFDLKLRGGII